MPTQNSRPNIVLILVDDMGFSDLGIAGSEIQTPNIDGLAERGVLLSSMYNCARCCPTRASLLTGLYPHKAGVGHMTANFGTPAYQGYLRNESTTIAEVLQQAGYRTLMAGKWHVGGDFAPREVDNWKIGDLGHPTPRQRGFDRFYGIVDGVTHFFSPHCIIEDDSQVAIDPSNFYFTDAITDKAVSMINSQESRSEPFFLYLAHAAPHWPLHAHEEDIAKYDGTYSCGWDSIRTARHETMLSRGILQHAWKISSRDPNAMPWRDVKLKDWEAARMAAYAAMIDRMDQSIGRVLQTLKATNQFDNTLIMFLSDNGGCAEFLAEDGWTEYYPETHLDGRGIRMGNRPDLRPGDPLTFMSYDLPWANVSNTPFRLFKHWVHEGGISTPMIAHWPRRIMHPNISHQPTHVVDVLPTIMSAANASYPSEFGGHSIESLDGESLLPLLEGRPWARSQPIFWEHEGNCAVREGSLKLVRKYQCDWELYDMDVDRTELNDISKENKATVQRLAKEYDHWAERVGVEPWERLELQLLEKWGGSKEGLYG